MKTPPRIPDFDLLWTNADAQTATEWFRLLDGFGGGFFRLPGTHDEGPAQAVLLLYIIAWSTRQKTNVLSFDLHKERITELLERWAAPLGGSATAQYPFWRLQRHRFWRVMSWGQYCEDVPAAPASPTQHSPDTTVGVLDPAAWVAITGDPHLRQNIVTFLLNQYCSHAFEEALADFGLEPQTPAFRPAPSTPNSASNPDDTPADQHLLTKFKRHESYTADALQAHLAVGIQPDAASAHILSPETSALFIADTAWHLEDARESDATQDADMRLHWSLSSRQYDGWEVLDTLMDAEQILVFTQEEEAREADALSYRYQGVYTPVSVEARRWSPVRQMHDVVLEWAGR
ncbi:hypothetical protein [Bradymonas sediminis]|uniref:ScoMcrA-like DNA sulfur-binding domain-containing protein n=1 Tax=Bradymonas sediminis TaxID=1548548 RepID=A0A2Z4FQ43_9DELT|nr:hypothetical protein [Bradymonas sediminis]AWV91040.1 hypothetical protein DN745_17570 [Bradymonas sediminis]TDP75219.1 hypothetical protein DFR33_10484 [Bradymonas sediminis]